MRVLTPSPKRLPSGSTMAHLPPCFSSLRISTRNRSAVSLVWKWRGKLLSTPVLFGAAKGRVGEDHVHPSLGRSRAAGGG